MSELEFRAAAEQFPLPPEERLEDLAGDIKLHGQQEAIRLLGGKIVDGRNRYLACLKAGVEPDFETLPETINPYTYVWSRNGERRDLTRDQRYLIWKSCSLRSGEWDAIHQQVQERTNQSRSELKQARSADDRPSTICGQSIGATRISSMELAGRNNIPQSDNSNLPKKKGRPIMEKIIECSRCRESYVRTHHSRMGICRWCEEDLITLDRELSRQCGLRPMGKLDVDELNRYWQKKRKGE